MEFECNVMQALLMRLFADFSYAAADIDDSCKSK